MGKRKKTYKENIFKRIWTYILSMPKRLQNFFFCLKYPFYRLKGVYTDEFGGYYSTWYDDIPGGWKKAFGKQLSKDLKAVLKKNHELRSFRFCQIKVKFGELRLYSTACSTETQHVLSKYEYLSTCYCIICGKPARYVIGGDWPEYICEDCLKEYIEGRSGDLEEAKKKYRLSEKDICVLRVFDKESNEFRDVDMVEEYGVDYRKLWGLDANE